MCGLQDIPVPPRGGGRVDCCGNHRQRCLNGRHQWAIWINYDGEFQRTPDMLYCHVCGGACTAGETTGEDGQSARASNQGEQEAV